MIDYKIVYQDEEYTNMSTFILKNNLLIRTGKNYKQVYAKLKKSLDNIVSINGKKKLSYSWMLKFIKACKTMVQYNKSSEEDYVANMPEEKHEFIGKYYRRLNQEQKKELDKKLGYEMCYNTCWLYDMKPAPAYILRTIKEILNEQ